MYNLHLLYTALIVCQMHMEKDYHLFQLTKSPLNPTHAIE